MNKQAIPEVALKAATVAIYLDGGTTMPDARSYATQALEAAAPSIAAQALRDAVEAFPLETITAPDNAVVWMRRRAEQIRPTP